MLGRVLLPRICSRSSRLLPVSARHYAQTAAASQEPAHIIVHELNESSASSSDAAGSGEAALVEKKSSTRRKALDAGGDGGEGKEKKTRKPREKKNTAEKVKKPPKEKKEKKVVEPLRPIEESESYLHWQGKVEPGDLPMESVREEIARLRPARPPRPDASDFDKKYTDMRDRICSSFNREQLRKYCEDQGVKHTLYGKDTRKDDLAELVMTELWEWPALDDIEMERKMRTEMIFQKIPLTSREAFFVLGQSGYALRDLAKEHDVSIRPEKSETDQTGIILVAGGTRGSLRDFAQGVDDSKKAILSRTVRLPLDRELPEYLRQPISRLNNTFIESAPELFNVQLHAKSTRDLDITEQLVHRAVTFDKLSQTEMLSYQPPAHPLLSPLPLSVPLPSYALYPFLSLGPLPWTIPTSGAFRIRRVGEWLGEDSGEDVNATGGLAGNKSFIADSHQNPIDWKKSLVGGFSTEDGSVKVSATFGHLIFTSPSQTHRTLTPPLTGSHVLRKITTWSAETPSRPDFLPSLPSAVPDAAALEMTMSHRLVYRVLLPSEDAATSQPYKTIIFESTIINNPEDDSIKVEPFCQSGLQKELDMLTPDRPMDIRFTASQMSTIEVPSTLSEYSTSYAESWNVDAIKDRQEPIPPSKIKLGDETYHLHTSVRVRQSRDLVNVRIASFHNDLLERKKPVNIVDLPVIKESHKEPESGNKTSLCKVQCDDLESSDSWNSFLKRCDQLSTAVTASGVSPRSALSVDLEGESLL